MSPDKLSGLIAELMRPTDSLSRPNLNALRHIVGDISAIKLNIKMQGYELARQLAEALPVRNDLAPSAIDLRSKPSTQHDLESDWCAYWLGRLGSPVIFHRKLWELAFVLQTIWQQGLMAPDRRGLGFGCGVEPIPSLLAAEGVDVVVTDLAPQEQADTGWTATNQHTYSLDAVFREHIVDRRDFDRHVSMQYVDMRRIPDTLRDFDFCWSVCALEHLGSIAKGLEFVEASLATLKPGGLAVHTTEFNFLDDTATLDNWATVLFQRAHFESLARDLTAKGHKVAPLDFDVGQSPLDRFIDLPPYPGDWSPYQKSIWPANPAHLKLAIDGFASTCFGLIVKKAEA